MVAYLNSTNIKKPHDVKCDAHTKQICTLVRYTNMLEGTVPQITEQAEKSIIFQSFPDLWLQQYTIARRPYVQESIAETVQFMATQKIKMDLMEQDRRQQILQLQRAFGQSNFCPCYVRRGHYTNRGGRGFSRGGPHYPTYG